MYMQLGVCMLLKAKRKVQLSKISNKFDDEKPKVVKVPSNLHVSRRLYRQ